ncbi:hypothetical protein SDC9_128768 [bioreactor metagenome]|uniref:Uncharacterized protein n=1 Tax=bioreactor metagenome TaxID=1076179 RepID=A0A645CXT6_9ZZZZ
MVWIQGRRQAVGGAANHAGFGQRPGQSAKGRLRIARGGKAAHLAAILLRPGSERKQGGISYAPSANCIDSILPGGTKTLRDGLVKPIKIRCGFVKIIHGGIGKAQLQQRIGAGTILCLQKKKICI